MNDLLIVDCFYYILVFDFIYQLKTAILKFFFYEY